MKPWASRIGTLAVVALIALPAAAAEPADSKAPTAQPLRLGNLHFPVTCGEAAQQQFTRAVAMLHTFWYPEARKAFEAVLEVEPDCAMAYWGIAMTYFHPLWEPTDAAGLRAGAEAIGNAEQRAAEISQRERDYIAALKTFYTDFDRLDHRTRALAYEDAMKELADRYPEDTEATIFYALSLLGTAPPTDKTYANQLKATAILEPLFEQNPDHPGIAHYIIHAYDYPPLAERALPAARHYAKVAPEVPHVLHMPSHIFTRLGLWQDAVESNLAVVVAAKAYAQRVHPDAAFFEQLHGADYLAYAYLQQGQDQKAKTVVEELASIKKAQPPNFAAAYAFAAVPARYVLERRDWSAAADLDAGPEQFPWEQHRQAVAIIHFARALGAARTGQTDAARREVDTLVSLRNALQEAKSDYWAGQVEILRRAAEGWLAHAQGDEARALELMQSAADLEASTEKHPVTPGSVLPAREMLGDLLLEMDRPKEALQQFEATMESSPNRYNALAGAAKAAKLAHEPETAALYYRRLLEIAGQSGSDRPALTEARAFFEQ